MIPQFRQPDRTGAAGRAWLRQCKSDVPDHQATLASWLVNVYGAHPFWQWWAVSVVHLRDVPGQSRPAHKAYPEAAYEFLIVAIDPAWPEASSTADDLELPFLSPIDVCEQFHGVDDANAFRFCGMAVDLIVGGRLSPDQDYRSVWREVVRDSIAHLRDGRHGGVC